MYSQTLCKPHHSRTRELKICLFSYLVLSYEAYSTMHWKPREGAKHLRWLIIHSTEDTLVDKIQSEGIFNNLRKSGETENVEGSWSLTGDHNQILVEEGYPEIVSRFVRAI